MVGLKPDEFWDNTWKQNHLQSESYEIAQNKEWERHRWSAYILMQTAINPMSGKAYFKSIKKPTDIFKLPQDNTYSGKKIKIDKDKQAIAVERHKKMMANINK